MPEKPRRKPSQERQFDMPPLVSQLPVIAPQNGAMGLTAASPLRLTINGLPPSVNHMYRSIGGARKALTDDAIAWRWLVKEALQAQAPGYRPPAGRLWLTMTLAFGRRGRLDIDNRLKAALDAVALACDFDDERIDQITLRRETGPLRTIIELGGLT